MTAPRFPLMGDPFALRGVDPRMAEFAQFAEDPAAAVVASSGGNSILFPRQPSAGILTPEDQALVRRNILLHLAAGLLQAGGRSPNQQGTLANIGSALAGIDLPGAQMSALRMRAITDKLNQEGEARHAFEEIARRYPALPGETQEERFTRLSNIVGELATVPGSADLIGKLSNVLAQLKPDGNEASDWSAPTSALGPDGKTPFYYQVNRRTGETRQLNIRPPVAMGRPQLRVVAGPNGPEYATINPVTGETEMTGQPASLTEAQQRVNALYGLVQDANQFLETQLSPSRIQYLVQTNGLNEFLKNNAEELEQASTQVADAYVRLTSGAAAREEEYVRARRLLTPHPGDDEKTLQRKIAARNRMLTAIRRGAGITDGGAGPKRGVPQQPGNPFRRQPAGVP